MSDSIARRTLIKSAAGAAFASSLPASPVRAQSTSPVTLRVAHTTAPNEPYHLGFESFKADVERGSNGAIKVEIFPNGQLGEESALLKSVQSGVLAIAAVANGVMADFADPLHLFDLPFLFKDRDQAYAAFDGPVGMGVGTQLDAKGFVLLGYYEAGVRNILNSLHPINSLADFKNMKIRVIPSTINLDTFRALGANPVPLQYNQLYVALQTHVVDAAEAANVNYDSKKFYEVAPYYAMIAWQIQAAPIVMSKKIFSGLNDSQQELIRTSIRSAIALERKAYQLGEEDSLKDLIAHDVKITTPDRQPWIDAIKPVWEKWEPLIGKDLLKAATAASK